MTSCSSSSKSSCCSSSKHPAQQAAALLQLLPLACLLIAARIPTAAGVLPFQQAAVDWTLVPDTPEAAANLTTSCICALLNGTCTPGCCCDAACPTELVQSFRAAGQCLPEGTPPQQLPFCVPAEPFAKVRPLGASSSRACVASLPCARFCCECVGSSRQHTPCVHARRSICRQVTTIAWGSGQQTQTLSARCCA
jgi:hypothetical protein